MDDSFNLSDPTDWLQTPTPQLAHIEAALRCQICKDFYNTPMITSCSHTFCSLCIRRCLTSDGLCPLCRAPDQEVRLRRNWTVEELVDVFQVARPALIVLGKNQLVAGLEISEGKGKRKLDESLDDEPDEQNVPYVHRRKTRSQTRRVSSGQPHMVKDDLASEYEPGDGLTACPICNQRMEEEEVFQHLDVHNNPVIALHPKPSTASPTKLLNSVLRYQPSAKLTDRLPQLNYSLLKDNALRKKLTELGIPSAGPRALLIKRHTEWVNIANANRDSSRPQTKGEMLQKLEIWDRTQGRQISNAQGEPTSSSSVMRKDFDGAAWATNHDVEFQRLICKAREKLENRSMENQVGSALTPGHELDVTLSQADQRDGLSGAAFLPENLLLSTKCQTPGYIDEAVSTNPEMRNSVIDLEADE